MKIFMAHRFAKKILFLYVFDLNISLILILEVHIELLLRSMHIHVYINADICIYFGFHSSFLFASNH